MQLQMMQCSHPFSTFARLNQEQAALDYSLPVSLIDEAPTLGKSKVEASFSPGCPVAVPYRPILHESCPSPCLTSEQVRSFPF